MQDILQSDGVGRSPLGLLKERDIVMDFGKG